MAIFRRPARIGRPSHAPSRDTVAYARLQNMFQSWGGGAQRPLVKATPANLRRFSRTVYAHRAIKVIKDAVATLAWEIAAKQDVNPSPEIDRQVEVLTTCFDKPNHDDSTRSFLEQLSTDIQVCGAGAFEHRTGGDLLRPLWLWPVDALSIQINAYWDGKDTTPRYYQSLGYGNVATQKGVPLYNDELVYIRSDPSTADPFGLGWVEVAFQTINRLLATADNAGNIAGNDTAQNMLFFKDLSQENLETVRGWWLNEIEGQGKTPIVGGEEAKVLQLRGSNDESLYLKYTELLIREIACASGVSPQNLAIERDVNRDTAEVAEDRDWRQTIIPHASLIASYINREVIAGRMGFSQVEFRFVGLDREDELDTAKILDYRFKNNSITPNEIRARFGEQPMENEFGDMTWAEIQIAIAAAKGAATITDPELTDPAKTIVRRRRTSKPKGK